jgi:phage terminase large subunit-like protein
MLMANNIQLRQQQCLPEGSWDIWVVCAGRGFGKTLTGAAAVNQLMSSGEYKKVAIIGATLFDARNVMVEGISGLININPNLQYMINNRKLTWENQGEGICFGGEHYNKLRGYQFDLIWIDEFAKINKAEELWQQINFCLRLGGKGKIIITTTPRNMKILKEILAYESTVLTTGSSYDNKENLSKVFFQNIQKYENTFLGHQEIHGKIINDNHLWRQNDIKYIEQNNEWRQNASGHGKGVDSITNHNLSYSNTSESLQTIGDGSYLEYIENAENSNELLALDAENRIKFLTSNEDVEEYVIGVDPAFGGDGETGIILAAVTNSQKYLVLDDFSGSYKPEVWVRMIKEVATKLKNCTIAVEVNHGGNIFQDLFKNFRVIEQRAVTSKYSRSMPCYLMYHNNQVLHNHKMLQLEEQMCNFESARKDRVDALVWALHYLRHRYDKYMSLLQENIFLCNSLWEE